MCNIKLELSVEAMPNYLSTPQPIVVMPSVHLDISSRLQVIDSYLAAYALQLATGLHVDVALPSVAKEYEPQTTTCMNETP